MKMDEMNLCALTKHTCDSRLYSHKGTKTTTVNYQLSPDLSFVTLWANSPKFLGPILY